MSRRPTASVRILKLPHLHSEAVRVEVDCRYSTTGMTSIPAAGALLTVPQMVTAATFEHEARCGDCDTSAAHQQGDQTIRDATEAAWSDLQQRWQRSYVHGRRN